MGIAERKLREKEEVRTSIIKASWNIVKQEGWQSLSIRKIADAIEYSAPVIYGHFANKEAILLEFAKEGFQLLNNTLLKAKEKYSSPEQQISALAYAYLDFAITNKEHYQLMYGLGMPSCQMVQETAELSTFTKILSEPIRRLIECGSDPHSEPLTKLKTFWSLLHGLVSLNSMDQGSKKDLDQKVIKEFVCNFIANIKG